MKRSRAFILSEQLMTIMLQAGFILVLCASFYQVISFYTRTQQVLTARNHAERVISFMDDKIRNAGLGLWRSKNPSAIRANFEKIPMLATKTETSATNNKGYKLPVALKWLKDGLDVNYTNDLPKLSQSQNIGDVLTLLYIKRNLSSGKDHEIITVLKTAQTLGKYDAEKKRLEGEVQLIDSASEAKLSSLFVINSTVANIKSYAVMEGLGIPLCLFSTSSHNLNVFVYGVEASEAQNVTVPAAGELLAINCMQMFVHDKNDGQGRQFAFRELKSNGMDWNDTYNQEKGILDIYMELDTEKNTFTLWILATGGYDASMNNPRPDTWPEKATWTNEYSHHIVYVSRATWKLNNIPPNFGW